MKAFIIYFEVIDPIGNAPIFYANLSIRYLINGLADISQLCTMLSVGEADATGHLHRQRAVSGDLFDDGQFRQPLF